MEKCYHGQSQHNFAPLDGGLLHHDIFDLAFAIRILFSYYVILFEASSIYRWRWLTRSIFYLWISTCLWIVSRHSIYSSTSPCWGSYFGAFPFSYLQPATSRWWAASTCSWPLGSIVVLEVPTLSLRGGMTLVVSEFTRRGRQMLVTCPSSYKEPQ